MKLIPLQTEIRWYVLNPKKTTACWWEKAYEVESKLLCNRGAFLLRRRGIRQYPLPTADTHAVPDWAPRKTKASRAAFWEASQAAVRRQNWTPKSFAIHLCPQIIFLDASMVILNPQIHNYKGTPTPIPDKLIVFYPLPVFFNVNEKLKIELVWI